MGKQIETLTPFYTDTQTTDVIHLSRSGIDKGITMGDLSAFKLITDAADPLVQSGPLQLGNLEKLSWLDFAGTGELLLGVNASDELEFNGSPIGGAGSVGIKDPVRLTSTANVVIATGGLLTIDGIVTVAGDRVLLKNQTAGLENGIYIVAVGAWTRATDFDTSADIESGLVLSVQEGTINADSRYQLTTNEPITLDTTALTFETAINMANQTITNSGIIEYVSTTLPADTAAFIGRNNSDLFYNVPVGNGHNIEIAGTTEYHFNASTAVWKGNDISEMGILSFDNTNTSIQQVAAALEYDVALGGNHVLRIDNAIEYTFGAVGAIWGGNNLQGVGELTFDDTSHSITQTVAAMVYDTSIGAAHDFRVNDVIEYRFAATEADFLGNNLVNMNNLKFAVTGAPDATADTIYATAAGMFINVPTGDTIRLQVNDSTAFIFSDTFLDMTSNNLLMGTGDITFGAGEGISIQGSDMVLDITVGDQFIFDINGVFRLKIDEISALQLQGGDYISWAASANARAIRNTSSGFNFIVQVGDNFSFDIAGSQAASINATTFAQTNSVGSLLRDFVVDTAILDDVIIGSLRFRALDGLSVSQNYANIVGTMESDIDASEDGSLKFQVTEAGVHDVLYMSMNDASSATINMFKKLDLNNNNLVLGTGILQFGTGQSIGIESTNMIFDVLSTDNFQLHVDGVLEYSFNAAAFDIQSNNLLMETGEIRFTDNTSISDNAGVSLQIDVPTGEVIILRVNNITEYSFDAAAITLADANNIAVGTTTGTKIGTATTQKIGFWNVTPVVQQAHIADATDAATVITQLNLLLAQMATLGLQAAS